MRFAPLLLAAVTALVLLPGLFRLPRFDQREARDALVARELIERREPLTPTLAGEPWFEKPVLAFAPDVVCWIASRHPADRSREVRIAVALLLLGLVASIGAEHFGARAGLIAAGALVTSLGVPLASRTDGTQLIATLLAWLGVSGFADATFGRRGRGREARLLVSWAALAAAFTIAGPLPALWPLGALALYGWLSRRRDVVRDVRPLAGLALVAGLALPWYGAMLNRHGAGFLAHALEFPYAAETRGSWLAGPLTALTFLLAIGFPWSALLPEAFGHAATWWRRPRPNGAPAAGDAELGPVARERREEHAAHFFIACLLAALVPVALYPGPPLPAALPALPAVALLVARLLDHLFEDAARVTKPLGRAWVMFGLMGTSLAVLAAAIATRVPEAVRPLRELGTFLLVASWLPFLASFAGRAKLAALLAALPVALGVPLVAMRVLPPMMDYMNSGPVAAFANATLPAGAVLIVPEPPPPSLALALERNVTVTPVTPAVLRDFAADDGFAYVAFRPLRERDVARDAGGALEPRMRTPAIVLARVAVGRDTAAAHP